MAITQKLASFRETCFIKVPTKDHKKLSELSIVVAVQLPQLLCAMFDVKGRDGKRIEPKDVKKELGIGKKDRIEMKHILFYPKHISFKTEYVAEILLYDQSTKSLINQSNNLRAQMLKFTNTPNNQRFNIKNDKPFQNMPKEKSFYL